VLVVVVVVVVVVWPAIVTVAVNSVCRLSGTVTVEGLIDTALTVPALAPPPQAERMTIAPTIRQRAAECIIRFELIPTVGPAP
jgi:hypothetical protein